MSFLFENLSVYQKAIGFAEDVFALTNGFPYKHKALSEQLKRASISIAANLAEGNGRLTKPDRKHFFNMSRGSIFECVALLEISGRTNLVPNKDHFRLKSELEEMSKMEAGLIRGLEKRC